MKWQYGVWMLVLAAALAAAGCSKNQGRQQSAAQAREALGKGVAAYREGQFEQAVQYFKKAEELDPTSVKARLCLGTSYAAQYVPGAPSPDDLLYAQQAVEQFKGALSLDPNNLAAIDGIGSMLFYMAAGSPFDPDMLKESATYHQKHIQLQPKDSEPYYWIGVIDWTLAFRANSELRAKYNQNHRASQIRDTEPLPPDLRANYARDYGSIVDDGIANLQMATQLLPDYVDAMAYLDLLYRQKADQVGDVNERAAFQQKAGALVDAVLQIKKRRAIEPEPPPAPESNQENQPILAPIPPPPLPPPPPPPPPPPAGRAQVQGSQLSSPPNTPQSPARPQTGNPARIRVAGTMEALRLISQTPPVYPPLARAARIQGDVVLDAIISKDGMVQKVDLISGHPLLVQAAEDAVLKWWFQPTLLNGEPVEVETRVTIHFVLGENAPDQPPNP